MRRLALAAAVAVVALLVADQLVLPAMAERHLRRELERGGGVVERVEVSAFPAVKLLWGHADRVRVRLSEVRLGTDADLADVLARTRDAGTVDARVDRVRVGPLVVRDLRLRKAGARLRGEAAVERGDLAAALPGGVALRPVQTGGGRLVLQADAGPLHVRARLSATDGRLVIAPDGLLGAVAALTLFDDPRVRVQRVGARPRQDGFALTAAGRLP